jgi:hypothetical protein
MQDMAKRKHTEEAVPTPETSKRPNRTGKAFHLYLQGELRDALDDYVDQTEPAPTRTAVVELALRRYLASVGFWPRKPPDDSP